jgi:hypothetical protein
MRNSTDIPTISSQHMSAFFSWSLQKVKKHHCCALKLDMSKASEQGIDMSKAFEQGIWSRGLAIYRGYYAKAWIQQLMGSTGYACNVYRILLYTFYGVPHEEFPV